METLPRIEALPRAERRRFQNLFRAHAATGKATLYSVSARYLEWGCGNPAWVDEAYWAFAKAAELGIGEEALRACWLRIRRVNSANFTNYNARPVQPKRDNKDRPASSRGSSGNTIRFPRKVRSKACWRRFYKLFPHLQPTAPSSIQ